ncbi:MAG TPA: nucleotidyl transferase AbiEii/AbiGii toxin family protein [Propylenella sp.]|nr:nucleotidyl transferase AbiEii/AbiGii toxin family protein [Propylenella sp.]
MAEVLDPRLDILSAAQREIWAHLRPFRDLGLVLYGGTAIALHLGHRESLDFDFFSLRPLDKAALRRALSWIGEPAVLQEELNTLALLAETPSGTVKLSCFGGMRLGRVREPAETRDGTLLVASLDDLMATKLKAILDRAEAKDYRDIAAMLRAGVALERGLAAFRKIFRGEPATVLKAIGYFKDGDLPSLTPADRNILRSARDRVGALPDVELVLDFG